MKLSNVLSKVFSIDIDHASIAIDILIFFTAQPQAAGPCGLEGESFGETFEGRIDCC